MADRGLTIIAAAALALSSCTVTSENAFPEAQTVGECQGQFQAAQRLTRQSMSNARVQNGGGGLLGALVLGIAGGASESNDQTKLLVCLERVGATPDQMRAAVNGGAIAEQPAISTVDRPAPAPARATLPSASCTRSSSVLVGGTGYCVQ